MQTTIMNDARTITEAWEKYAAEVIPPQATDHQHAAMRQAFFIGALVIFNRVFEADFKHRKQEQFTAMRQELAGFVAECLHDADGETLVGPPH
jgi:hypothetical protein